MPLSRPRNLAFGIAVVASLVLTPTIGASASPQSAAPTAPRAAVSALATLDIPVGPLQFSEPGASQLYVGNDTAELVIEPTSVSGGGAVQCFYSSAFAGSTEAIFTASEWDSGRVVFPIMPGQVLPYTFGASLSLDCFADPDSPSGANLGSWFLVPVPVAGRSVVVADPQGSTVIDVWGTSSSTPVTLRPGQTVRVFGDAGTFAVAEAGYAMAADVSIESTVLDEGIFLSDYAVAADGSSVTFTVPAVGAFGAVDITSPVTLSIFLLAESRDGTARSTSWSSTAKVVAASPSTTRVSLPLPFGLSFLRSTATATVTSAGEPTLNGTLIFRVDGKKVATVVLTDTAKGVATVKLPFLTRGRHAVTATYSGSQVVEASVSTPVSLRVFF